MIALLVTLMLTASPAQAQDLKRPELQVKVTPFDMKTQGMTFPSGLQVILQKDEGDDVVHVATVHTGGTLSDTEGKHGTAHLAQHMVLSAKLGGGNVRDVLYAQGCWYSAFIGPDWLVYQTAGPAEALPAILQVEGLRITDPFAGTTEADLAREKTIYGIEPYYSGVEDIGPAFKTFAPLTFADDQPFAKIGQHLEQSEMAGVTMDDLRAHAKKVYIPSETTIVISGNIDFDDTISELFKNLPPKAMHPDATEEDLRQFFKPDVVNPDPENPDHVTKWLADPETDELIDVTWEPPNRITWADVEPFGLNSKYTKGDVIHVPGLATDPIGLVAWAIPGAWIGEDARVSIAAQAIQTAGYSQAGWGTVWDIKSDSRGGRMAFCLPIRSGGAQWLMCRATARDRKVNADELTDRLKSASAIFADPTQTFIHQQAAENGRRAALGMMLHTLENHTNAVESRTATTALDAHYLGDPGYNTTRMNDMMALDRSEVQPWVRDWLPEARSVSVVIDPIPREKWLNIPVLSGFHGDVFGHTIPKVDVAPTNEEIAAAYPEFDASDIQTRKLSNGLEVIVVPHGNVPIVSSALVFGGGVAYENGLDSYATGVMRRLENEIYEDPTGRKQDLLPERIGAQGLFLSAPDITFEGYAVPSKNLDGALYLLRRGEMARKVQLGARPPWWKSTRQSLPMSWDMASTWAIHDRMQNILPEHPLSWFIDQDAAIAFKDMGAADLVAYQKRKYHVDNATMVVVGAVEPEEAFKQAEAYWGSWTSDGPKLEAPPAAKPANPGKVLLYDKTGADNTTVAAVCRLPDTNAEMAARQEVLASVTDEALIAALDESGAKALASNVRLQTAMGIAYMDFAAVVPHEQAAAAVEAIRATIAKADEGTHDPDRLQQHKLRIAGSKFLDFQTTRGFLDVVARNYALPYRGKDYTTEFGKALVATDADALKNAAAGCAGSLTVTIETPAAGFDSLKGDLGAEVVDWLARADAEFEKWDKGAYKKRLKNRAKGKK